MAVTTRNATVVARNRAVSYHIGYGGVTKTSRDKPWLFQPSSPESGVLSGLCIFLCYYIVSRSLQDLNSFREAVISIVGVMINFHLKFCRHHSFPCIPCTIAFDVISFTVLHIFLDYFILLIWNPFNFSI